MIQSFVKIFSATIMILSMANIAYSFRHEKIGFIAIGGQGQEKYYFINAKNRDMGYISLEPMFKEKIIIPFFALSMFSEKDHEYMEDRKHYGGVYTLRKEGIMIFSSDDSPQLEMIGIIQIKDIQSIKIVKVL